MKSDSPIVDEVRQRRHAISERFGHDRGAYGDYLKELEKKYKSRDVLSVCKARLPAFINRLLGA